MLIDSADHRERIAALRAHPDAWIADTGDLGLVLPETKLVRERLWPPVGLQPTTLPAEISDKAVQRGEEIAFVLTISCGDPGASIGYRLATEKRHAGPWRIYTGPFEAPADHRFIEVRTHRIGQLPCSTGALLGGE
jgi:hypothetical protein